MATGILAILDDIAMLMDDTATMSKVAVKKTAGLLGDDLAVNAEKATGFHASRELPVIWQITKGALLNKIIILPLAFLLSAFAPWLIVPILLIGGAYLSYEGAEKIYEWLSSFKKSNTPKAKPPASEVESKKQLLELEAQKIKAAIRTDFILSIEIIIITLETVIEQSFAIQLLVVSFIALVATFAVYGLVALMVRMDDTGLALIEKAQQPQANFKNFKIALGKSLVAALPKLIRLLMVVGTIAMLLVGGGLFVHNLEALHHLTNFIPGLLAELSAGLIIGLILLAIIHPLQKKWLNSK